MLSKIRVIISITTKKGDFLNALNSATAPENDLAPKFLRVMQRIKNDKLVFECDMEYERAPGAKIESLRRTVDDFIFSLGIALRSVVEVDKYVSGLIRDDREGY